MSSFAYKGRDSQGNAVSGVVDAANEMAAAEQLMRRGVMPTELKPGKAKAAALDWSLLLERGVRLDELVVFSRQMYALTRAGIPILRAIAGLEESAHSKPLKRALHALGEDLGNGRPLSSSMQAHPRVFSSLFVAIIHVGENTGQLEEAFLQLANYFELELETRKRIKTAMRYPSFVLIAIGIAMVILNIMVIPVFAGMFAKFGVELPLATRILLATSHFFVHYWWVMLGVLLAMVFGWRRWVSTVKGKLTWHRWQLKLPIVGTIIERSLLARFARSFSMMLKAGVPLNTALSLVADAVDNAWMAGRIRDMRAGIERGESLLRTAGSSGLFTPLVMQMIAVGEETGQVDDLLHEAAEYYEREVDYDLKSLTARIEPILIGIVAVMVLILALGIFTPMWDMMRAVRGK
ncbi:MSHA biogenesis protein MshG [Aeromonas hydrophila]|uniref:GspF family protein n=1 Tax=Aeromonas hydrophila subsp. hydrophila (strain ATCC 7966 / DSM 30187 / BCRC 13018 / CCUG 14551 / JCM 1027 / KCTC 2358 / NCIMB 9240 / NCTC 8049) TaxID=380703 RepID=A0KFA0_AERHH|nr:MSHA fimbrial biogenesis protein MshG [Aeromonas hydrophila]ABK38845.1 GspF family protein [Aeromonas hydrophila subsp. hydrophila ATCC 7966]EHK5440369.1 MSHA fimbrial biogenesis protein MshG [Aeromonas hydrophila]EIS3745320.1 MSHA fimbrial biogenesis protein MshG [Aeromonas hydrophila]ELO1555703.1 MSHA fimbrial biogenesis protein MshG [Aeromonas hydrophila]EZH82557.1 MSHA biogenesis protein MshG [Aeromonas hydrophila AD9]